MYAIKIVSAIHSRIAKRLVPEHSLSDSTTSEGFESLTWPC